LLRKDCHYMSLSNFIILLITGILVGFINVISAGGSLISLPILIFLGLPSSIANGTNRIAILIQNITAFIAFLRKDLIKWKISLFLSIPAIIGSFLGAELAIDLSDDAFNNTIAIIMVGVVILILFKPHTYIKTNLHTFTLRKQLVLFLSFIIVGFYGGFIQAGVGFLIIAFLTILAGQYTLIEIHIVKTVITFLYLLLSTIVFIVYGQINWLYAIVLAIGTGIGGWFGTRFAISISEEFLRITMTFVILLMAIKLLLF